ncbi:RES family NAD+ phosphorylase [Chloroflexota bacterium]
MADFRSWQSYYEFEQSVRTKNRYIRDLDAEEFLSTLLTTSRNRTKKLSKGNYLWRSQVGHRWKSVDIDEEGHVDEELYPLPPERMKPLPNMSVEGRANPKGISYLYLATDKETAMAEVRPWLSSLISVGQFRTMQDLIVIDCSTNNKNISFHFNEPSPEERKLAVWSDIDRAFSMPINPADNTADYISTQIIAELFKNDGADGIIYRSALGDGSNVVLFDLEAAQQVNCFLYEVKGLSFDFTEATNPYFLKE